MAASKPTVGIYTLGCKVNQYESEAIAELFEENGFAVSPPSARCDAYVINTCTVTAESDRKAGQFIRRAIHQNPSAYILVTGCFSQTQPNRIAAIGGVDYICGNAQKRSVVEVACRLLREGRKPETPQIDVPSPDSHGFEPMQIRRFERTRAYVKIEDGCENHCAYCIIPAARGRVRSKDPAEILCEVKRLTEGGCREIVLTGIETASFGKDLDGYTLADLLCEIDRIDGIGRIRLGSLDPSLMKQSFVDRIAGLHSLAPHFHLSMQSGSDKILALMKRKYNTRMALEGMERLRRAIPNVQFTTDMIVGFPQESEEDFAQTVRFAEQARFLMIHVFPYSQRAGTVAAKMDGQIPTEIKRRRAASLIERAERIRADILRNTVGSEQDVLFETYETGIAHGHTPSFIEVFCPASADILSTVRRVRIESFDGTRCHGSILHSETKEAF